MLLRCAAKRPERVLQALGQGREAFAAEHDVSVLEAGEDEPEVIEAMIERLAGDGDAERAGVGEVGQPEPAGLVRLAEDHLLLWPMERPPGEDPSLQRAADIGVEVGMTPAQLLKHADHPDARRSLQDRRDLGVPVGLGSGRRRPLGSAFAEGRRGSVSIRYPLAVENSALAAAASTESVFR
jgi:hypothetical protein